MAALRRHIAPHRLARAAAGRLSPRDAARIADHLAACDRCDRAAHRLERARTAMHEIATQPDPELRWDHIGARVYWSTSSARHAAMRHADRPWWRRWPAALGLGLAVAGAVAVAVAFGLGGRGAGVGSGATTASRGSQADRARPTPGVAQGNRARADSAVAPHDQPALEGVVTFARGDVLLGGQPARVSDLFARSLGPGTRLATRAHGRLVVQFGRGSGFVVGPNTSLELRRFDRSAVELAVERHRRGRGVAASRRSDLRRRGRAPPRERSRHRLPGREQRIASSMWSALTAWWS